MWSVAQWIHVMRALSDRNGAAVHCMNRVKYMNRSYLVRLLVQCVGKQLLQNE